ncbi:MAG TPA: CBS domain-containing protein [Pyrinomonadaceae bacterium]|nr:CBS domain-containing protein [Pyrinomonadaceae bacterium]
MTANDLMTTNFVVCTEDLPLIRVFEQMDIAGVEHAVVVESLAHSMPIGLITEHDICEQVIGRARNPRGMTAANVMNTNVKRVNRDIGTDELARVEGTKIVCVIDENGKLCGTLNLSSIGQVLPTHPESRLDGPMIRNYQVSMLNRIY